MATYESTVLLLLHGVSMVTMSSLLRRMMDVPTASEGLTSKDMTLIDSWIDASTLPVSMGGKAVRVVAAVSNDKSAKALRSQSKSCRSFDRPQKGACEGDE
jgi:hypothetical protein